MRDSWFCGSCGTVSLNFLLHVQNCTSENCRFTLSFLANWNLYPMTESTERSPPPIHKWRKYILRVGGRCHVHYRGNVHLWPKSDESKKSLVLFYLFTLCPAPKRRAVRGWGNNILEDARHWTSLLQYNLSTGKPLKSFCTMEQPPR